MAFMFVTFIDVNIYNDDMKIKSNIANYFMIWYFDYIFVDHMLFFKNNIDILRHSIWQEDVYMVKWRLLIWLR